MSGLWLRSKNSCKSRLWHVPKTIPRVAYTGLGMQSQECLASVRLCWHSSVRAALVSACFPICSCSTQGDIHWCKAHLEGSSEEEQSLRLCSLPRRLYKEKCRAPCPASPSCCRHRPGEWPLAILAVREMSGLDLSMHQGKEEGLNQTGGLFLQCHLAADTYCSNVWQSKLS